MSTQSPSSVWVSLLESGGHTKSIQGNAARTDSQGGFTTSRGGQSPPPFLSHMEEPYLPQSPLGAGKQVYAVRIG